MSGNGRPIGLPAAINRTLEAPCCGPDNPRGGCIDESYDPAQPTVRIPRKVVKGGSFLCAANYCRRYRPAARHAQMIDSGMSHIGFRCVFRPHIKGEHVTNETKPSTRLNRRAMLLSGTSLVAATGLISAARAQGTNPSQSAAARAAGSERQTQHRRHLGRRHRHHQPVVLLHRTDGLSHAEHRSHRARRHAVHRLLRRTELHRRPIVLHHRPERVPHRSVEGWCPGVAGRA